MPDTKTGSNRWVPDIRPENIDTYTETNGEQSADYKLVDAHPIIGGILNKLAFFRTHAAAVWYNRLAGVTVKQKLDELNENLSDNDNITQKDVMMYRFPATDGRNSDANNFKKTGYYYTAPDTANASDYGIISVLSVPAPWITQVWRRLNDSIYYRTYSNINGNAWSEWKPVCITRTKKECTPVGSNIVSSENYSFVDCGLYNIANISAHIANVSAWNDYEILQLPINPTNSFAVYTITQDSKRVGVRFEKSGKVKLQSMDSTGDVYIALQVVV